MPEMCREHKGGCGYAYMPGSVLKFIITRRFKVLFFDSEICGLTKLGMEHDRGDDCGVEEGVWDAYYCCVKTEPLEQTWCLSSGVISTVNCNNRSKS